MIRDVAWNVGIDKKKKGKKGCLRHRDTRGGGGGGGEMSGVGGQDRGVIRAVES